MLIEEMVYSGVSSGLLVISQNDLVACVWMLGKLARNLVPCHAPAISFYEL